MSTTTATPTGTSAFDAALDSVVDEGGAADATEETSAAEGSEATLELEESAATETADGGKDEGSENAPDAEAAAAEVADEAKEELELEAGDEKGEEAESEESEKDELEEELEKDEEIKPDREGVDKSGKKQFFFGEKKTHRLLESHADMKAIKEKIPGATVEMLEENFETSVLHNRMLEDFDSGYEGMARVLNYMVGNPKHPETVQAVNPQSVQVFAASLPVHLAHTHPKALATMENVMYDALVRDLYRKADEFKKTNSDEDAIEQQYRLAERLEEVLFDKVERSPRAGGKSSKATGEADGLSDPERRELDERRRADESRQQQTAQQRQQQVAKDVADADREEIDSWIAKVESQISKQQKEKFEFDAEDRDYIHHRLGKHINAAEKGNTAYRRQFDIQRSKAARNFSEESREQLKAQRRQFAGPHVRRNLRNVMKKFSQNAMDASERTHQRQKKAQEKRQAPPGERTSRVINVAKAFKEKKMTYDDLVDRV